MEMVRQFPPFRFSGNRAYFLALKDNWEGYLQLIRQGMDAPLNSFMMLTLLRAKLDEATGMEVALKMRDPQTRFEDVHLDVCRRFGGVRGRQSWKSVRLQRTERGVTPAEWRRFRVELLLAVQKNMEEDEDSVRDFVLQQLPESWRLIIVKQELRRKANVFWVKVGVPPGETAEQLWRELDQEVAGLRQFSLVGRNIQVECRNREAQNLQLEGGSHQLKVQLTEPQCTVYELCEIIDQGVEELEEMGALSLDLLPSVVYPVQVVEQEIINPPPQLDMTHGQQAPVS